MLPDTSAPWGELQYACTHTHMHTHACSSIFVRTSVYMMHFLILIRSEKTSQIALTLLRSCCAGHRVTRKQYVYSSVSTGTWMQNNRKQQEAEALFVHHRCPRRYVGHVCGLCFPGLPECDAFKIRFIVQSHSELRLHNHYSGKRLGVCLLEAWIAHGDTIIVHIYASLQIRTVCAYLHDLFCTQWPFEVLHLSHTRLQTKSTVCVGDINEIL